MLENLLCFLYYPSVSFTLLQDGNWFKTEGAVSVLQLESYMGACSNVAPVASPSAQPEKRRILIRPHLNELNIIIGSLIGEQ